MTFPFARGATFESFVPSVGLLVLRPIQLPDDGETIHGWVTQSYAEYWNMNDKSRDEITSFYSEMDASDHEAVLVGTFQGRPTFLVEVYDPARHELARHYDVEPGDRGMHVLVAPAEIPIASFTSAIFRTVMGYLFADESMRRVVVEPDVRNNKIHVLNERFGFVRERVIQLKDKQAALCFCTRERFRDATGLGEAA